MLIFDTSSVTLDDARAWAVARGGHQRYIDVAAHYWELSPLFGIPADVPYGQAGKETNKGHYTGVVGPERHNWCGMKTAKGGGNYDPNAHAVFHDDRAGVIAHLWHLYGYAGGKVADGPGLPMNDPRFHLITDYTDTVEGLGGPKSWAPSPSYGRETAAIVQDMRDFARNRRPTVGTPYDHIIPGMIDARSRLATATPNQGGVQRGPYETLPLSAKRGVVVHYRGVVTDASAGLASFEADATYHVGKNWTSAGQVPIFGSGIMYHVGIDGEGNTYLMRDLERVLWHCGAWPQNAETLAIQLPLGGSQRATKAQLESLTRVVDAWLGFTRAPRSEVWGHQELSSTSCPGTLMQDFVRPYREAKPSEPTGLYFPETGYSVSGGFRAYWEQFGGLAIFGYPITGEYQQNGVTVQLFERARFEWHPGSWPERFDVQLGLLGVELLAAQARIDEMEAA